MVTSPPPSDLIGPGVATPGVSHRPLSAEPDPAAAMTVFWEAGLPVAQALTGSDGVTRRTAPAKRRIRLSLSPQPPSVSVVICTRDRPEELRRCLASLPAQTLRPLEVIVVDNASSGEATRTAALNAGVVYVREDRPGLDYARNTGAATARGEIVAYTDDDVLLHPKHPVTRGMVRESSHHEESADLGSVLGLSGPLLRLTFLGEITYQPVLENIEKALGVSFNILEGVIGRIKDTPYGQLTVQVIGSEADVGRVEAAFEDQSLHCEVLGS